MSHTDSTSIHCNLGDLTVERTIATELWNQVERERLIAIRAHQLFCSRGCEHGLDVDDWLQAERELSSEASDVVITREEVGFEISIAERSAQARIALSIAPSSLLILWSADGLNSDGPNEQPRHFALSLSSLQGPPVDPEKTEVTYDGGRVRLRLPFVGAVLPPLAVKAPQSKAGRRERRQ
ncbi:MAG TPA: DUF2934 domain-containing protein [Bryobacteraceae bacterium]|nr:DUF2934 domain-containing protein [Bryobacteraceae bacterium]